MSVDLVSEVDRRFFANNLLTNEDWESGMDQFTDISDILGMDTDITPENLAELPDELLSLDGSCSPFDLSDTRGLPMEDVIFDEGKMGSPKLDYTSLVDNTVDEYWKEQSDSSDSGIYGETGVHIKQEPPSPVSSNCSDAGSDGYGSGTLSSSSSSSAFAFTPVTSTEDIKPTIIINTAPALANIQQGNPNINSILNSKIKIQPKPTEKVSAPTQPKRQPPKVPVNNKPLVLSGEEFARLTASGALRFQPPGEATKVTSPCKPSAVPSTTAPPAAAIPAAPVVIGASIETEGKAIKRQQRMIKNRESASLSRKRKKEYLSGLEDRLKDFTNENHKLKQENECLKRKLIILQSENEKLKKTYQLSPAKKTCLLGLFVLLSFNIGFISNLFNGYTVPIHHSAPGVNIHHGRQLLAVQEEEEVPYKEDRHPRWKHTDENMLRKLKQLSEEMAWTQSNGGKMNQSQFESLMCPTFFNKTESIRLAEQLAGWMIKHEAEKKSQANKRQKRKKEIRPVKTLKKALRGDFSTLDGNKVRSSDGSYQVQVFDGKDGSSEFLDAIHRRNDTFYVLSFNTDYLLVPASAHNKTMRPRMSLVMPIVGLNETMKPPPGSIGMMQIDCEVLSTQLIHVQKSVVPSSMYSNNGTNHGGST